MPTLNWVNSVPGPKQKPLAKTVIGMRVAGAPGFDVIKTVLQSDSPNNALVIDPTLADGDYEFQATEVDTAGVESPNKPTVKYSVVTAFDPPSGVTALTITP